MSGSYGKHLRALEATLAWKMRTEDYVSGVDISGDGNVIVVGSYDHKVYAVNGKGEEIWNYDTRDFVRAVAVNNDGDKVLAGTWNGNLFLLGKDGKPVWETKVPGNILSVAMDGEGDIFVVGSSDKMIRLFNPEGEEIWSFTTGGYVSRVDISADGGYICVGSRDTMVYFLERGGNLLWKFKTGGLIKGLSVSDLGEVVTVGSHENFIFHLDRLGKLLWVHRIEGEIWDLDTTDLGNLIALGTKQKKGYLLEYPDALEARLVYLENLMEGIGALGADISSAEKMFKKARKLQGSGDLEGLTETVRKTSKNLEKVKEDFLRSGANDKLMALEEELGNLDNKDTTMIDLLVQRARELYEEKRFDRVTRLCERGLELISQLPDLVEEELVEEGDDTEGDGLAEDTQKEIRKAERTISSIEKSGMDLAEAKDLLEQARTALDDGHVEVAKELASEAITTANAAKEAAPSETTEIDDEPNPMMAEIEELVVKLKAYEGDDVEMARDFLEQAKEALGSDDEEMAADFFAQATDVAENLKPPEKPKKKKRVKKKKQVLRCPECNKKVRPEWTDCAYCKTKLK